MKNGNEKAFWRNLLSERYPDWTIKLMDFDTGLLADQDVALYLYDTSNSKRMCCLTKSKEMRAVADELNSFSGVSDTLMNMFCRLDADTSFMTTPTAEVSGYAMELCLLNITTSHTYRHVLSTFDNLAGHWLTLIYRFPEDGRVLLRPSFQQGHAQQLLTAQDLHAWAAQVVSYDLAPRNPLLSGFINDSGPPMLAQRLLNRTILGH